MRIKPGTYRTESGEEKQLVLRHPFTKQFVPSEGIEVDENDPFWLRRLRDRDVVLVEAQAAPKPPIEKAQA